MRYIKISKFCELTDYTDKAVRLKIDKGDWIEGQQFRKAPDGHILIDVEGYEQWVEGRLVQLKPGRRASGSSSRTSAAAA